jgi:hypothetical protein
VAEGRVDPADLNSLADQVAALEQVVAELPFEVRGEDRTALVLDAAERLGYLAAHLQQVGGEDRPQVSWITASLQPEAIAEIAPLVTWRGFNSLEEIYEVLKGRGLLSPNLNPADMHAWFTVARRPIAEHVAATTGREVMWVEEGGKWTLSFIERGWEDRVGVVEPEPVVSEPPLVAIPPPGSLDDDLGTALRLVLDPPPPASTPPAAVPTAAAQETTRQDKNQDPPLSTYELSVAAAFIELLLPQTPRDPAMQRTQLLAEARARLGVSRSKAADFDAQAKALLSRLRRRGVIVSTRHRQGGYRHDLEAGVRLAWQRGPKGQDSIIDRLTEPFPPSDES